ncbi:MAG: hypothetical protein WAU17_05460 [Nitrospirales bacterium]
MVAVAWPFGCPASFAAFGGAQTRYAQTMRAFLRNRLQDLASPQGHGSLLKEGVAESLELLRDGIDVIFCAAGTNFGIKRYQEGAGSFFGYQSSFPWEADMGAATAGPAQSVST